MKAKRKRILVGLAAGTALTLTLGLTAQAEELDSLEGTGGDPNPTLDSTPAPYGNNEEEAGGTTSGTDGKEAGGETVEPKSGETDVSPEATATPVVTVGGYNLADEANASAGWVAGENSGSGWRYDGTSVSMVNNGSRGSPRRGHRCESQRGGLQPHQHPLRRR